MSTALHHLADNDTASKTVAVFSGDCGFGSSLSTAKSQIAFGKNQPSERIIHTTGHALEQSCCSTSVSQPTADGNFARNWL
ncbi:MAG: hypothetical protein LBD10_09290 [Desulfobulbus sp.]|jgi:hypothetical protein|uniref:hypothetical protein n=1 Tax=Desulfobulbus sp. TaxID=895 RepID=UPI00284198AA|nr:hypothetical protein [Desulfobulbus sp.]MDR2550376.1 hypothetical protein [Desulfobulbus sp.]